ncbi:hypothetical protein PIB30_074871, partial [Stylosanthes scabra]|nr:hypothetical protein [Stylosanthes scabra]
SPTSLREKQLTNLRRKSRQGQRKIGIGFGGNSDFNHDDLVLPLFWIRGKTSVANPLISGSVLELLF